MQSALYPSMYRVLQGIDPGLPSEGTTLAEGIAVKEPGQLTRRIVAELVGAVRLVTERQLEAAIELLIERQKLVVEGAGAAGLAALMAEPERFRGRRVGIVLTGGNIDARLLASLLMRGLVRGGRLVRLRAELPDLPGVLSRVAGVIGGLGGNIVEVHHQRLFHDFVGEARRARPGRRNAEPAPCRDDHRRAGRRRISRPAFCRPGMPRWRDRSPRSVAPSRRHPVIEPGEVPKLGRSATAYPRRAPMPVRPARSSVRQACSRGTADCAALERRGLG